MPDALGISPLIHECFFPPLPGFYQSPSSRRGLRFLDGWLRNSAHSAGGRFANRPYDVRGKYRDFTL
jgi:hypothetical protein